MSNKDKPSVSSKSGMRRRFLLAGSSLAALAVGIAGVSIAQTRPQPPSPSPNAAGKSPDSKRTDFLYYYESRLTAIRMGPWKLHFVTKENYYDSLQTRATGLMFNLRSDPFESYDSIDSFGHLAQRQSWIFEPASEVIGEHLKTLAEYPPVQRGSSIDMSNVVQEFLQRKK